MTSWTWNRTEGLGTMAGQDIRGVIAF